ncbi:MAG: diacylglycerol/lipid kinase family protein [Spirochaetaceae bacterium]
MKLHFRSTLLLVNPTRTPRAVRRMQKILKDASGVDLVITTSKEDFVERVRAFTAGSYRYLLIWGGDGTAHDAINALFSTSGADDGTQASLPIEQFKGIGFLRGGTGNGIQDSYSVPYRLRPQLEAFADSIQNDLTLDVDLLEARDGARTVYGQLIGVGADAEILKKRDQLATVRRNGQEHVRSGLRYYVRAGFRVLLGKGFSRRERFKLLLNDGRYAFSGLRVNAQFPFDSLELTRSPFMIEIGTRPYYGKLLRICPDVVCNNGACDVYVFDFRNRRDILGNAWYIWTGRHGRINRLRARTNRAVIERYEVKSIELISETPFRYHIDGELVEPRAVRRGEPYRLNIRVLPQSMRFIVPRAFYNIFHPFER